METNNMLQIEAVIESINKLYQTSPDFDKDGMEYMKPYIPYKSTLSDIAGLIKKDALIDSSISGQTALMFAAGLGSLELVKLLIAAGADVNACDEDGRTPLIYAAFAGDFLGKSFFKPEHIAILKMLIVAGADVNAKDVKNKMVMGYALSLWIQVLI
jgi:ankyrin repeat protein